MNALFGIDTPTPGISRVVQDELFRLGREWGQAGKVHSFIQSKQLQVWDDRFLTHSDSNAFCEEYKLPTFSPEQFLKYSERIINGNYVLPNVACSTRKSVLVMQSIYRRNIL